MRLTWEPPTGGLCRSLTYGSSGSYMRRMLRGGGCMLLSCLYFKYRRSSARGFVIVGARDGCRERQCQRGEWINRGDHGRACVLFGSRKPRVGAAAARTAAALIFLCELLWVGGKTERQASQCQIRIFAHVTEARTPLSRFAFTRTHTTRTSPPSPRHHSHWRKQHS